MEKENKTKGLNVAIDLGNSNTILTDKAHNSLSFPSYIAFHQINKDVKAFGKLAYEMLGKTNENLKVIKPLKGGVITDFDSASVMFNTMIENVYPGRNLFSRFNYLIAGIPYSTTEVERRALRNILNPINADKKLLIFEPIAAAIGMGIDIRQPSGVFIVDVGGGITEIAVISLSGIVMSNSTRIAGDTFNVDIQEYIRKTYRLEISLRVAENIKIGIGMKTDSSDTEEISVIGKCTVTGIPKKIVLTTEEIINLLDDSLTKIEAIIIKTLEECPPELAGDIYESGIHLTGGGALIKGFKERLEKKTKLPVFQDQNALLSVSAGILKVLDNPEKYKAVLFQ